MFAVASDPQEGHDLLDPARVTPEAEAIAASLTRAALEAVPAIDAPRGETVPIDAQLEERLRALGYLD